MPMLSAERNVELPLLLTSLSGRQRKVNVQAALEIVGLADRAKHKPSELSGGQQQRVAIARSLINRPQILFADEPTGNLDTKTSKEILKMFQDLAEEDGITVVLVTHDPGVANYARRVVRMCDGLIVEGVDESEVAEADLTAA
jgi:putative ABC transport system ATP-binding protein